MNHARPEKNICQVQWHIAIDDIVTQAFEGFIYGFELIRNIVFAQVCFRILITSVETCIYTPNFVVCP